MVTFVMQTGDVVLARPGTQIRLPLVVSFLFRIKKGKKQNLKSSVNFCFVQSTVITLK